MATEREREREGVVFCGTRAGEAAVVIGRARSIHIAAAAVRETDSCPGTWPDFLKLILKIFVNQFYNKD